MKRGFVYSASGQQPKGRAGHQDIYPRLQISTVSPRKRKRSPETQQQRVHGVGSSSGTAGRGGQVAVGREAKVSRQTAENSFEEEEDLDELGAAALEQYELTQRERSCSPSPTPGPLRMMSPFIPPTLASVNQPSGNTSSTAYGTTQAQNPNPVLSHTQKWPNPYQTQSTQPQHRMVAGSRSVSSSTSEHSPAPSAISKNPEPEAKGYVERIQQLQEQNYTKEGEVKVLRSEKQRLVGELKKKEEQMHELHTRLLSEQQTREQQLSREKEALSTQLQFKEQELLALRQKCAILEKKQKSSSVPPSPVHSSALLQKMSSSVSSRLQSSSSKEVQFLSTETFMPLSQMAPTEVTPVHVGQKRSSLEGGHDFTENSVIKPKIVKRPSPVSSSEAKGSSQSSRKDSTTESSNVTELSKAQEPQEKISPSKAHFQESDPTVVLKVPNKELSGAQLLMLLIQHELLEVPEFVTCADEETPATEQQPESHRSVEDEPSKEPSRKLTGLLSLLHLGQRSQDSFTVFPNILATPISVNESQDSFTGYKVMNLNLENTPKTPVRRLMSRPPKPHTCARTDISKTRSRLAGVVPGKALSTSNTPIQSHLLLGEEATALANSVDKSRLEKSIASLLRSADSSKFVRLGSGISAISPISCVSQSPDPSTHLLHQIGNIIVQYHCDQLSKAKASASNVSGYLSDLGENLDSSSVASPSVGSTISSKTSSDLTSPPKADQDLASQALELLEILVTYNKAAREQILMRPPQFLIDSGSSSAMDFHSQEVENGSMLEEESMPIKTKGSLKMGESVTSHGAEESPYLIGRGQPQAATPGHPTIIQRKKAQWKGVHLVPMKSPGRSFSEKVWTTQKQSPVGLGALSGGLVHPVSLRQPSRGCGQLFTVLLELPAPPWRETVENTVRCLKILSALAEDCSSDTLERFSPLLEEETVGICLDKEDPQVTLAVLTLLAHIVKSPTIVGLLCSHQDPCIPLSCYQCLLEPPTAPPETVYRIRIQLVRMISNILVVSNGSATLLESCSCSFELLKTLVALLSQLIQDVFSPEQLSSQDLILVQETVLLIHKVSIHDRFFDTHRENCDHAFVSVLNTLSWLLQELPCIHEVSLVNDLLEYCEETEDSSENSETQETVEN